MTEHDPLLQRLRDLPSATLDPRVRDRTLVRAEAAFRGTEERTLPWGRATLAAAIVVGGAIHVVHVVTIMAHVF
jgi:hypothetical protein